VRNATLERLTIKVNRLMIDRTARSAHRCVGL